LEPFRTTLGLSAAVQKGFLGLGNGFNKDFRVATEKTVVFEVFGISLEFVLESGANSHFSLSPLSKSVPLLDCGFV